MEEKLIKAILNSNHYKECAITILRNNCPSSIGLKDCGDCLSEECFNCWAKALGVEEDV